MKYLNILATSILLLSSSLAYALDKHDAGVYVLLDSNDEPTDTQMRYYLQGNQWLMDGRHGNQSWQTVCSSTGECRLSPSKASDVEKWRQLLPNEFKKEPFSCVDNQIAFAFCRTHQKGHENKRLYWWIMLVNKQAYLLSLNRLK